MTNDNRGSWNRDSDAYQKAHGKLLSETATAWGVWRIPEADLGVLGNTVGRDVLELGCGAAQWSIALVRLGALVVGIDLSERQLKHAQDNCRTAGITVPLVHGSAESLPFQDGSFDIVFCDHGATTFSPPEKTIPEASRVLKPRGLFAFCISSPIRDICFDSESDKVSEQLKTDYFGLRGLEEEGELYYQRTYGGWIRLFRENDLEVEDLIELQAPEGATTTYADYAPIEWARRWPAENIWKLKKRRLFR
jgi:SAM-dependent methyltransferase